MPRAMVAGAEISYAVFGVGEPVILLPPAGTRAAVWQRHQVPALVAAGYRAIAVDFRGTPPLPPPTAPYDLADLVSDVAELLTMLGMAGCRFVGASLGAMVAQELALARPDLVRTAVLLGTRCRVDAFRAMLASAQATQMTAAPDSAAAEFAALSHLAQLFGARTLADDRAVAEWFELFRVFPLRGAGPAAQYRASVSADRAAALAGVRRPCLVVGFAEDVLTPPALCREVADAIPGCRYVEVADCGHFGFLERPDHVNKIALDFLATGVAQR
jgi:pimeloyl-ACP methyl ester carboxylesterase